jgi:hypothetical protein
MAKDERLEALMEERARQDAALAEFEEAIGRLGRFGTVDLPEGFLRDFDEACEVTPAARPEGVAVWNGIRA